MEKEEISISTENLFPQGFPADFSILIIARPSKEQSFPLLTLYSAEGDEQLSVTVGREIGLYYEDDEELPVEGNYMTFNVSAVDEQWHSLAFSIKGDSVTLIFDCHTTITKALTRGIPSRLNNKGLINLGYQLLSDGHFQGDIFTLEIADKPDDAYELCNRYSSCLNEVLASRDPQVEIPSPGLAFELVGETVPGASDAFGESIGGATVNTQQGVRFESNIKMTKNLVGFDIDQTTFRGIRFGFEENEQVTTTLQPGYGVTPVPQE
ncbi:collagen alpha-2(XI) chain-like [Euwallacea similis]|uniref:collagen alpha-2(XI) chain-like n=1 Tax=Euwallacea similis TaxID=1736056 RepID=UPI00344C3C3D